MKKTITVNLNGRVFNIDEDAYRLLDNYLSNLRIYFRKEEGASEIVADFEARIEELFSEKMRSEVITIEQVEEVIAQMGKPDDFAEKENNEESSFTEPAKESKKKFYRNVDDKKIGGVCSGISAYFGWDVLAVRIIFIVLLFVTSFGIVPLYLLTWIIAPEASTAEEKLQMHGKPVTLENIGKTVASELESVASSQKGCLTGFINFFVGLTKAFLIFLGILVGLPLLFALVIVIIVLLAVLFGVGGGLSAFVTIAHPALAAISLILVVGIPVLALIYAIIAYFAKFKPINRPVKWTFLIIWILAFALMLFSGFKFDRDNCFRNFRNWSFFCHNNAIQGNGILSEKTFVMEEPVVYLDIDKYLCANLQIEQIQSDTNSLTISGDENMIDKVVYDFRNGHLNLSSQNPIFSKNDLIITLQTNGLKNIRSNMEGKIQIKRTFIGDELYIDMQGSASLCADSLYLNLLTLRSRGAAFVNLSGKTNKAKFDLSGTGAIDAFELLSDTVYARVNGVGSIQCNPVEYLVGQLNGVGKITYKGEPKAKNIKTSGVGKIGKE